MSGSLLAFSENRVVGQFEFALKGHGFSRAVTAENRAC